MNDPIVCRGYRLRIYPSPAQALRLTAWEGALRFLWNLAHEQRKLGFSRPRGEKRFASWRSQCRELTDLRACTPWLADVSRQACSSVLARLDDAWRLSFDGGAAPAQFKRRGRDAVSVQLEHRAVTWKGDSTVRLEKIGVTRIRRHRELPGRTVRVTLVRDVDQWFAVFTQEIPHETPARLPGAIGIDRGVVSLVADSKGRSVEGPRFAARSAAKVRRLSQALSRTKKASKNRAKARLRLARAHRKVRRQRAWLQHQISHDYAKSHGVVVIEKLETARMTRSARGTVDTPGRNVRQKAGLNRSILDAGWSGLADKLRYKLEERGGELVEVPAAYSSQTCSACGVVDAASRRTQSEFCCTACGYEANADTNAARVILSRWSPPVQPVEPVIGRAVKQEAVAIRGLPSKSLPITSRA